MYQLIQDYSLKVYLIMIPDCSSTNSIHSFNRKSIQSTHLLKGQWRCFYRFHQWLIRVYRNPSPSKLSSQSVTSVIKFPLRLQEPAYPTPILFQTPDPLPFYTQFCDLTALFLSFTPNLSCCHSICSKLLIHTVPLYLLAILCISLLFYHDLWPKHETIAFSPTHITI